MSRPQHLVPEGVARPIAPYSAVVRAGDTVYVSGQVAFDVDRRLVGEEVRAQTRQTIENLERCLRAAGCGLADVVKVTAFVARRADVAAYNEVYAEFFAAPHPARTTVVAGLSEGILVEIEAIAQVPAGAADGPDEEAR